MCCRFRGSRRFRRALAQAAPALRKEVDPHATALGLAGGKGANLGGMVQAGLPVPPGFVVLTIAYRLFAQQAGIQAQIERLASGVDADSQESLDTARDDSGS